MVETSSEANYGATPMNARFLMTPEEVQYVSQARLEIATMVEADQACPILFRTMNDLTDWTLDHGIGGPLPIPGVDPSKAVRFGGTYKSKGFNFETHYGQVWAHVGSKDDRLALVNDAVRGFDVARADLSRIHADHVLARSRVRDYPDAWSLMFPVHAGSNSPFGAIEKRLGPIRMEVEYVKLDPLIGLKLFCGSLPRNTVALDWTMRDVKGQFDLLSPFAQGFCKRMEREASKHVLP